MEFTIDVNGLLTSEKTTWKGIQQFLHVHDIKTIISNVSCFLLRIPVHGNNNEYIRHNFKGNIFDFHCWPMFAEKQVAVIYGLTPDGFEITETTL